MKAGLKDHSRLLPNVTANLNGTNYLPRDCDSPVKVLLGCACAPPFIPPLSPKLLSYPVARTQLADLGPKFESRVPLAALRREQSGGGYGLAAVVCWGAIGSAAFMIFQSLFRGPESITPQPNFRDAPLRRRQGHYACGVPPCWCLRCGNAKSSNCHSASHVGGGEMNRTWISAYSFLI